MPANPNHSKAARNQAKAPREVDAITEGVANMKTPGSRKEREAMEAAAAKERYMKLHAAGKTDEAKADLARLKLIREQREAEALRRQVGFRLYQPAVMRMPLTWLIGREGRERGAGQGP
jgi:hypothetical protein